MRNEVQSLSAKRNWMVEWAKGARCASDLPGC